jgi:hypothetical protein
MTPEELAAIFLSIPPHEPLAVTLLRERRAATGELFPSPGDHRTRIVRASVELKQIADETEVMIRKLNDLRPIALRDPRAEAFIGGYCL